MAEFSGTPAGSGRRFAVVASRFNETITRRLVDGALDALVRHGVKFEDIDIVWVPGAWELPVAVQQALDSERYDAIVAIGAVIRGETPHFEYVSAESIRALATTALEARVPVTLGILTCDTMQQAEARAGGDHGNKGWDSAVAALEMADLMQQLDLPDED